MKNTQTVKKPIIKEESNDKQKNNTVHFQSCDVDINLLDGKEKEEKNRIISKYYHGIFYGILSAAFLSCANVLIKKAELTTGSEQSLIRYVVQAFAMALVIVSTHFDFFGPKGSKKFLILRGSIGTIAMLCLHFAVKLINPSDAVALLHLNSVLITVFARFALSEKISLAHVACLVLSALGVLFIAQPSFVFGPRQCFINKCNISVEKNYDFLGYTNFNFVLGISLG